MSLILDPRLLWLLAWFALAFLGALPQFWRQGSAVVHDQREAGNLMGPIVALLGVPVFFIMPIAQASWNTRQHFLICPGHWSTSWPWSAGEIPVLFWQLGAGLRGTLPSPERFWWGAGRVFRVGILSSGTPPKLTTLLRWLIRP